MTGYSKQVFLNIFIVICVQVITAGSLLAAPVKNLLLLQDKKPSSREKFGAEKLVKALTAAGYKVQTSIQPNALTNAIPVLAGQKSAPFIKAAIAKYKFAADTTTGKEGFTIYTSAAAVIVAGNDASGVLYGCMRLADEIKEKRILPADLHITDQPEMVLRGTCIGLQKPTYLPGRHTYEYPYTPETFPWLYDKKLWIQVLDSLAENRMNSLYLWNGHPFASLVKLKDYPYAVEVDDATFKKNEEIFGFITEEADKRGIWVIQMFYNIFVSKPFAEKHNIKTQDRERPITPLIADYTRKSIAAFVEKYPNVGLMVCLGEAMEGVGNDDVEWFTKTIIPGVKDGLAALGKTTEPPLVLRAHDTDAPMVMKAALPLYKNLYTEAKFNGEALTTYEPRGTWAELHRTLSRLGSVQIENVHIMANLEPFRYGSPDFIQKSALAMHSIMEANGLHLYPQASYWDWPYTADNTSPRLLQIERDWLWNRLWARYAWKAGRNRNDEVSYWSSMFAAKFSCSINDGRQLLTAYEEMGEIAPKILRRFGITDGNRQTMTLGMTMPQLINPRRFGLFELLYTAESPEGEMLIDYAKNDYEKRPHVGETPPQIIREIKAHGDKAVQAAGQISGSIKINKAEFERIKNDMYCYRAMAYHYAEKTDAALDALRYKYSGDIKDLNNAYAHLEKSVHYYKELTKLTRDTYLYANSMQTQQRKIPYRGVNGTFKTWVEVLPEFEKELRIFKHRIDSLRSVVPGNHTTIAKQQLSNANVTITGSFQNFILDSNVTIFTDKPAVINNYAAELKGLRGLRLSFAQQGTDGTTIRFNAAQGGKMLVGFFVAPKDATFLKEPELETNASANDYGQADIKIANALIIKDMPAVNIHTYNFKPGANEIKLAKGACIILGFVPDNQPVGMYDAGLNDPSNKNIDWLFE